MKKLKLLFSFVLICIAIQAQVSKTLTVANAGTLSTLLTSTEKSSVTNITLSGNIDARDFVTMRDAMPVLASIDLSDASIMSYNGPDGTDISITSYQANEIPIRAFFNSNNNASKTSLQKIIMPISTKSIGELAFYYCKGLTSISIPPSVTSIKGYAFNNCIGIHGSLTIPSSVNSIGGGAFENCFINEIIVESGNINYSSLAGVLFDKNQTTLIYYPLGKSSGNYLIPSSVTSIDGSAFISGTVHERYGGSLTSITIPSSVTHLGGYAFAYRSGVKVVVSQSITPPGIAMLNVFDSFNPDVVYVPASAVAAYKSANGWNNFNIVAEKRATINVATAGGMAAAVIAAGCGPLSSITHLTLTGNINSVDIAQMKTNMTSLTAIDLSGTTIDANALPANAFQNRTSLTSVVLPATLLSIGDYAFDGCSNLSGNMPLPASVTSVGAYAFKNCNSLSDELTIPSGIKTINNGTFYGCRFAGALTIPSSVISIGGGAFSGCSRLTGTLFIPSSITSIGSSAFSGCSGFSGNLTIPNSVTSLGEYAFSNCTGFGGTLTLSNTLTTISSSAFYGCSQLSGKVDLPLSITSIGSSAFEGCAKITELSVGKNLTSISDRALYGCTNMAKISVPRNSPPTAYNSTFAGIPVETCVINVASGAALAYQIANYWSLFINYTETLLATNYTVTVNIGSNGGVKESNVALGNGSVVTAAVGSTKTFAFVPNAGYAVATVTYDGVDITSQLVNNQYTTSAINANAVLNVSFQKIQYRVLLRDALSGTINLLCDYGATPSFDFTPDNLWHVNTVKYNNVDVTASLVNGVYTLPAITANAILSVSFVSIISNAPSVENSRVKVYTKQSEIVVEGTSLGETIAIYSLNGIELQSVKSIGERIVIPVEVGAAYLVKTSTKTFKVIL